MQYLPRGFMSFKMRAIIISIPLDSWVAMHVCKIREEKGTGQEQEGGRGGAGTRRRRYSQREGENMHISKFPKEGPRT